MKETFSEWVYQTLSGELVEWAQVPGVENLYEEGKYCQLQYKEVYDAYQRICTRLGTEEEDDDLEIIINAFMNIDREMCLRMYEYGAKFGMRE